MSTCDTMFLWEAIKCVTWTNQEKSKFCGCKFATDHFWDSAHIEKLEYIIVHRSTPIFSSSTSLSPATPTICTILMMFCDGEIVRKPSRLLKLFKHAVIQQWQGITFMSSLHSSDLTWWIKKGIKKVNFCPHFSHFCLWWTYPTCVPVAI